ncbi:histidinol-phosphate transaminase [Siminovitchia acidinfaciens]|uniref:Histidinol-phosphate aminotransferase n=1 Tax=Siminovitchia acidinfaciens TaxID=2321395 RepID=A0A429XSU7_9BACI|nr:histidinol-phosphate transaminase [Siminovitchia acidinfaciens]RST70308.1 histidinol-phosphate transaminase [Siminovitchia acidinfaciens]
MYKSLTKESSKSFWREQVKKLDAYIPGKSIEETKKEYHLHKVIRLASNESPFGPSPKAIEAMKKEIQDGHLYPDSTCTTLRERLGELHGIDPGSYVVANGADNIINLLIASYVNPGDEVVYCTPTFSEYSKNTLLMGGTTVEVPTSDDFVFDLEMMLEAITEKTKLAIVCNPNNPTGTIVDEDKLRDFLNRLPGHVIPVLDEAYIEFVTHESYATGVEYIKEGFPVISIRTFSKLYGLAGMRVGYAVASEELIEPLLTVREPFACNRIAQAAAVAAIDDYEYIGKVLCENRREMTKMIEKLHSLGFEAEPTHTNFIFVNMKQDSSRLANNLLKKGFIIRPCAPWGYPEHARISIGTAAQNEHFFTVLEQILTER